MYYAYFVSKTNRGICSNWKDCEKRVKGVTDARFKSFKTEYLAAEWLKAGAKYEFREKKSPVILRNGVYFDAGTGRGNGVEISVTNKNGGDLLHTILPKKKINKHGKHLISRKGATNNYGELLALFYAIQISLKDNVAEIFGDSKLVIDYWSRGIMKVKELPKETVLLGKKVSVLRREFESAGGKIGRISGDDNPADLGFH